MLIASFRVFQIWVLNVLKWWIKDEKSCRRLYMIGICRLLMQSGSLVCLVWFLKKKRSSKNLGIIPSILPSSVGVCRCHVWVNNPIQSSSAFVKLPKKRFIILMFYHFLCVWSVVLGVTFAKCQGPQQTHEMSFTLVFWAVITQKPGCSQLLRDHGSSARVKARTRLSCGIKCQARFCITCP